MTDETGEREAPRLGREVPVTLIGRRDPAVRFCGLAVGISENGFGMRSRDEGLGRASVHGLLRQPIVCRFDLSQAVPDVPALGEIVGRVIRVEPSRRDLRYLYFLAVEFLEISNQDTLILRSAIEIYDSQRRSAPYPAP